MRDGKGTCRLYVPSTSLATQGFDNTLLQTHTSRNLQQYTRTQHVDSSADAIENSAIDYDETDRDKLEAQLGSKFDITAPLRLTNCIDRTDHDTGRCTLAHDTESRLKKITHSEQDSRSRTSQGKTKFDENARNANSMFHVAFPYQHPFNHGYRADPSLFPYPHDSNIGNTEFEQGTLDQIAGAEVRAHREHKRMTSSSTLPASHSALNPKASVFTPSQFGNVSLYR